MGRARARVTQETAWDDLRVGGSSRAARFVDVARMRLPISWLRSNKSSHSREKSGSWRIAAADAVSVYEEARRTQLDVLAKTARPISD